MHAIMLNLNGMSIDEKLNIINKMKYNSAMGEKSPTQDMATDTIVGHEKLFNEEFSATEHTTLKKECAGLPNSECDDLMHQFHNGDGDDHAMLQIEINSQVENEMDCDTLGILELIEENNDSCVKIGDIDDESNLNDSLLTVMSDHNYTSSDRSFASSKAYLRNMMISHIFNRGENSKTANLQRQDSEPNVQKFVDSMIGKLSSYNLKEEPQSNDNDDGISEAIGGPIVHDEDIFVQNVMDAVAADEEDENEKKLKYRINSNDASSLSENNSEQFNPFHMTGNLMKDSEHEYKSDSQVSFAADLSEPMEHLISDVFDYESQTKASSSKLLDNLINFATGLLHDCATFQKSSTNQDLKLNTYVLERFNKFKQIVHDESCYVSSEQQTDSNELSPNKKRFINKKNKKDLLRDSSTASSSSDDEQSTTSNVTNSSNNRARARIKAEETGDELSNVESDNASTYESPTFNPINDYDDGISMSQYIQSDFFESTTRANRESISPDRERATKLTDKFLKTVSDNENSNDENGIVGIKKICESFIKKKRTYSESDKENKQNRNEKSPKHADERLKENYDSSDEDSKVDKEIERLININALGKRTAYGSSKTFKDADKQRKKTVQTKNKKNYLDFSDDEFAKSGESDEGISEAEDEIITEEQYLAKRNENLKQELLNPSSSESEVSDDDINEIEASNSDEDGSKSPLVDKFLKSFVVEESDEHDESSDIDIPDEKPTEKVDEAELSINKEDGKKLSLNSSPTVSDNEVLNDSRSYNSKQQPRKSLEKMLSEVEKRKKLSKIDDDLISLSSESAGSDIESVENEAADKKARMIKPMLRQDQLRSETRKAQKEEVERIRRLEKKQSKLAEVLKNHTDADKDDFILDYIEETKTFIKVHAGIVKQLKKHQFDGVKFMYDSCYGSAEALKKHAGSGCILAHCMGLGKTLQLIALLHTVISYKELKTSKVLVLCPKSTVMNWSDEVMRWLAPLNTRNLRVYTFNDTSDIHEKIDVIKKWSQSTFGNAGALLIGYEAFRTLVHYHSYKNRSNISTALLEEIREKISSYLLKPGADLVVCDEGHIIKNSKSAISTAVSKIVTPRRIVLTGTPIQNNLKEYYSMVNFIKPLFLGTEKEFANLYANPIKNGQHKDSSKLDIKIMKQRSFVLHKKLSKFVQRKEAELLKTFLPQKFEYVLFLPMTEVQNNLYEYILEAISRRQENRGRTLITDYTCLRKIWTHPKVLEDAWKNATDAKNKKDAQKSKTPHSDDDQPDDIYDSQTGVMSVTNDWWRSLVNNNELETIMPSNKLRATFEILRMCEEKGEKCLIFSAFVAVLNVVEYFFRKLTNAAGNGNVNDFGIPNCTKISNQWILGKDYYRLDGKTPKSLRHEMIKQFNMPDNKRARVFLISSKAGGQGINLIGANRVIILDTSWNPSNDQQNIFRIFRLGQKKKCYIYRLLAMGTMEEKVYSRSVTKQAMSYRVVDEQQIDRHYSLAELAELYTLTKPDFTQRPVPVLPQDSILASLMLNYPEMVYKYHEHDSLLENKVEQELSEQEKADAWIAYERDLQMSSQVQEMPNMENIPQGNFTMPKIPNYMGLMPGLDMQSLLKYSTNNMNKSTSPYIKSLMAQYPQYPQNSQHQQYLDMLHMYQNYLMNFPNDSFNATSNLYPQMNNSNPMPANSAAYLASLHANNALNPNPLSALDDLSMFGIGANKSLMGNLNNPSPFASSLPTLNATLSNFAAPSSAAANLLNATNNPGLPTFGQYNPSPLESNYSNHYNFGRNSYTNPGPSMSPGNNAPANPTKHTPPAMTANFLSRDQYNKMNKSADMPSTSITKASKTFDRNDNANMNATKKSTMPMSSSYQPRDLSQNPITTSITTPFTKSNQSFERTDYPSTSTFSNLNMSSNKTKANKMPDNLSPRDQFNKSTSAPTQNHHSNTAQTFSAKSSHEQQALMNMSTKSPVQSANTTHAMANDANAKQASAKDKESAANKTNKNKALINAAPASAQPPPPAAKSSKDKNMQSLSSAHLNSGPATPPNDKFNQSQKTTSNIATQPKTASPTPALMKSRMGGVNMGISYPSRSSPIPKNTTTPFKNINSNLAEKHANVSPVAKKLLSNSSDMQIILTTSAPTSVAKQYTDISPSISLTAVIQDNPPTKTTVATTTPLSSYKTTGQQELPNKYLPENHPKSNITSMSSNARKPTPLQGQKSVMQTMESIRKPILAQPAASNMLPSSTPAARTTAVLPMQPKAATKTQIAQASVSAQKPPPVPVAISKNVFRNSPIPTTAQLQNKQLLRTASPSAANAQISIKSSTASVAPANKGNTTGRPNFELIKNNMKIRAFSGNAPDAANAQFDKSKMLLSSLAPTSSGTTMQRNAINIRPASDGKNKSATKEAYVIETSINDRRLEIGTPTKSGGGTTITKISKKRPVQEDASNQSRDTAKIKRFKQSSN